MDKQKQIEEMAKVIHDNNQHRYADWIDYTNADLSVALKLYNADYRKIPENAVVLTREEYERLCDLAYFGNGEETIRKETAEKIADWLDNEKGYCGLGYLVKQKFCTEEKEK